MGMFKKKKHEREPEDYYSGTYDKWIFDGEDSDDDLKNKIPYYKSLCIDDLIKKCGHDKYNEIVEKYELEV